MGILVCPVCREKLVISGKNYVCPSRHSFDIAKSGYVNLLLSKHVGKSVHGDNKLMVHARRDFLDKGFYAPLRDAICEKITTGVILDAGCGEGYYTSGIKNISPDSEIYGIDISKTAVDFAVKRNKNITFAVASVFNIPVADSSCDSLVTVFSPYCSEEFRRVLKNGGNMFMAIPSENHLWELKKAVYDTPYKNKVKPYELEGFGLADKKRITYKFQLENQNDIQSLFSMTPYYYRTGKIQHERLSALESLEITADFELLTYKK
ncbi:MAG: methyltransferase domain-containing protein [Muribaculaceae bacterium]|nr:methyltransferase domain-containing protein [Alistipes senegalensis]MCM1473357.1 methyltransferase domain-containing protein [Muribaculaceae bacterium]